MPGPQIGLEFTGYYYIDAHCDKNHPDECKNIKSGNKNQTSRSSVGKYHLMSKKELIGKNDYFVNSRNDDWNVLYCNKNGPIKCIPLDIVVDAKIFKVQFKNENLVYNCVAINSNTNGKSGLTNLYKISRN
ncbi:hypothetical protein PIROE2DRAFT_17368 [Piromyces sp. E2]|nr:hypothetical protein PIROE2DRAFT_17368 [Piromyces sp. E2]|eukprot:OUM57597.1 hypothetical protein PIROE2DRAFT_17368 [Piromyces sp. E2]